MGHRQELDKGPVLRCELLRASHLRGTICAPFLQEQQLGCRTWTDSSQRRKRETTAIVVGFKSIILVQRTLLKVPHDSLRQSICSSQSRWSGFVTKWKHRGLRSNQAPSAPFYDPAAAMMHIQSFHLSQRQVSQIPQILRNYIAGEALAKPRGSVGIASKSCPTKACLMDRDQRVPFARRTSHSAPLNLRE